MFIACNLALYLKKEQLMRRLQEEYCAKGKGAIKEQLMRRLQEEYCAKGKVLYRCVS